MDKYKLLAFDLDGTLLRGDKTLSELTKKVVRKLSERFIIVLASGRMAPVMIKYAEDHLQLKDYFLISYNGGACLKKSIPSNLMNSSRAEFLFHDTLPELPYERILDMLFKKKLSVGIYNAERVHFLKFDEKQQSHYDFFIRLTSVVHVYMNSIDQLKKLSVIKILIMLETEEEQIKLYNQLKTIPSDGKITESPEDLHLGDQLTMVRTECFDENNEGLHFVEILPKGVNKGRTLSKLISQINVEPHEIISFGDGLNDLELLQLSGLGYCMPNGHTELKKVIPLKTQYTNDEDGVAKELISLFKLEV